MYFQNHQNVFPLWVPASFKYEDKQQLLTEGNPMHKVLHKAYGLWNAN